MGKTATEKMTPIFTISQPGTPSQLRKANIVDKHTSKQATYSFIPIDEVVAEKRY